MDISLLSDVCNFGADLFQICRLLLCPIIVSFTLQFFSFMKFCLSIVSLKVWAIYVLFRKKLTPGPTFCSLRFSLLNFTLISLNHLHLSFVQGKRYGSIFILLHVDIQLDQHHLLKTSFYPHCMVLHFLSKIKCP